MKSRLPFVAAMLLITSAPVFVAAQDVATHATFAGELAATLERARDAKRGVVIHVNGAAIAGAVRRVGGDVVVVANREHGHVVVRLDRIDAVEAE